MLGGNRGKMEHLSPAGVVGETSRVWSRYFQGGKQYTMRQLISLGREGFLSLLLTLKCKESVDYKI